MVYSERNPNGRNANAMRSLFAGLWLGLLAWPFMGWRSSVQLAVSVALGLWLWRRAIDGSGRLEKRCGKFTFHRRLERLYASSFARRCGIGLALILPLFLNNYYIDTLSLALLYAILAVGLNVTVGQTGLLDLGYAAFYGIGAYLYALLSTRMGLPFWPGLLLGGVTAALFGLLLGMITLRLQGDYLAIVTLGFVQIVYLVLNNWDAVTHGPNGILQIGRPRIAGFQLNRPIHFYYLALSLLTLTVVVVSRLTHSQIGRAFLAIREDPVAAAAMGINVTWMKIGAFALGAGIAGVAGVFFAAKYAFVSPESFNFQESVRVLSMVVLGGMGSLPGAVLGALLLTLLPEFLRELEHYRMLVFGMALVVMMRFRPQGLWGGRA